MSRRSYAFTADYKLSRACARARQHGLPATLSQEQWRDTLEHFRFKCAYCLVSRYEVLEHFIPIAKSGGTTKGNCIPACRSCNARKDSCYSQVREGFSQEALERVRAFLEQYRDEAEPALDVTPGELIEVIDEREEEPAA